MAIVPTKLYRNYFSHLFFYSLITSYQMCWSWWDITRKLLLFFLSLLSLPFQTAVKSSFIGRHLRQIPELFSPFQVLMNCPHVRVLKSTVQYTFTTVSCQIQIPASSLSSGLTQAQKGCIVFYYCIVSCLSLAAYDSPR